MIDLHNFVFLYTWDVKHTARGPKTARGGFNLALLMIYESEKKRTNTSC